MNTLFRTTNFAIHWLTARYTLGYNVHSPYLYDFTRNVIYEENPYYCYSTIEQIRHRLLKNNDTVFVQDFGTGQSQLRIISHIAKTSLAAPKEAQLLFRIANYIKARNILELGTSLGITTAYLTAHSSDCRTTTLEGSENITKIARQNWKKLNLQSQIKPVVGNINETLPLLLKDEGNFDIIYFDANHTCEATLEYFRACLPHKHENSIFIFDDIYYSADMKKAWEQIRQNSEITATIDLYSLGIVFFNKHFIKKNYKMRF